MLLLRSRPLPLSHAGTTKRRRWSSIAASTLSVLLVVGCAGSRPAPAVGPLSAVDSGRVRALSDERSRGGGVLRGTIGVMPFASTATDTILTPLAYALADLVSTDLSRSRQVQVVERARFGEVMRELDLAASGRLDSATAPRVGRLVSAERMVFGSIATMPDGRMIRLGARIGDVEQASLSRAVDAQAPLSEILAAEKALVLRLFETLGIVLTPAERAAVEAQPTKNLGALLAYGKGMQRYYQGDTRGAAAAMRQASRLDPTFRDARIRAAEIRAISANGTGTPIGIPGVRPLGGAISSTVDRLNRPLDLVTNVSRALSSALDPTFPTAQATVIITITRP
jgi:hypothetical protein